MIIEFAATAAAIAVGVGAVGAIAFLAFTDRGRQLLQQLDTVQRLKSWWTDVPATVVAQPNSQPTQRNLDSQATEQAGHALRIMRLLALAQQTLERLQAQKTTREQRYATLKAKGANDEILETAFDHCTLAEKSIAAQNKAIEKIKSVAEEAREALEATLAAINESRPLALTERGNRELAETLKLSRESLSRLTAMRDRVAESTEETARDFATQHGLERVADLETGGGLTRHDKEAARAQFERRLAEAGLIEAPAAATDETIGKSETIKESPRRKPRESREVRKEQA
jgi:hypothetical protein